MVLLAGDKKNYRCPLRYFFFLILLTDFIEDFIVRFLFVTQKGTLQQTGSRGPVYFSGILFIFHVLLGITRENRMRGGGGGARA